MTTYYEYEGDATSTYYGCYLLRQTTKHLLYQVIHTGSLVRGETTSSGGTAAWKYIMYVADIILALLIVLVAYIGFILPLMQRRKPKVVAAGAEGGAAAIDAGAFTADTSSAGPEVSEASGPDAEGPSE